MTTDPTAPPAAEPDYVPFGDEWRAEVMKMRKHDIISLYRDASLQRKFLLAQRERLKEALLEVLKAAESGYDFTEWDCTKDADEDGKGIHDICNRARAALAETENAAR